MRGKFWTIMALALVVPGLMLLAGCPPKDIEGPDEGNGGTATSTPTYTGDSTATPSPTHGDPDPTPIPGGAGTTPEGGIYSNPKEDPESDKFENDDIYFEFDSSALSATAQGILKDKANFMNKYKGMSIVIEGHCDERGTNEYNLALGDRRAESAKSFLLKLGISASRMTTISYGEEKPVDAGHDEAAWAKNRRAHFVIK